MADRYWVGGAGTWDGSSTTHWAASSGGSSGASVPTSADNVFVDSNSGFSSGGTITLAVGNRNMNDFTSSVGHSYTIDGGTNSANFNIYGSCTLESGFTFSGNGGLSFQATATGKTITAAGATLTTINFYSAGGGWTLQDDMVANDLYIQNGTLDANGHNITCHGYYFYATTGNTPTINMGSGNWIISSNDVDDNDSGGGVWWVDENNSQTVTFNPSTSTIKLTDSTANSKTFFHSIDGVAGGGHTYNNIWFSPGSGTGSLIIVGSNTFNDFKDNGTAAHSILFTHGTTTTVTTFTVTGSAGNLITINSDTTATHSLVKSGGGVISCDYLSIQHSVATPGSTWYAGLNSTNNQGVSTAGSGWIFTAPPALGNMLLMFR